MLVFFGCNVAERSRGMAKLVCLDEGMTRQGHHPGLKDCQHLYRII